MPDQPGEHEAHVGQGRLMAEHKPAEVWPPHTFLSAMVAERGWDAYDLAREMRLPPGVAADILTGVEPMSPMIARMVARALDTSPELWLNLRRMWDEFQPVVAAGEGLNG